MDIHRCRFVPYQPQSINALAFSHVSNPKQRSPQDLRLAVGRENGDVEIWNPLRGNWIQERVLRGGRDRTIEQLAWTQDLLTDEDNTENPLDDSDLRLFSSGGSSSITEWDLATGQLKRHAEGTTTDIWCFAAQPQWRRGGKSLDMNAVANAPSQLLAAGCADGSVVLFTTADDDLQFLRILSTPPVKKTKVISIAWRDRNTIVAGYEDSTIRIIDVQRRTVLRSMSLGKPAKDNNAVVWTLKCLPDGTILSGDSTGELKIWDAVNFSLVQRLKTHEADILDIATSFNGETIFTTGVDRRVVVYKQLPAQAAKRRERWQRTAHRRFHQHDVKALAPFESKELSVMVSGGMDTVPMVLPLRKWDTELHRSLSHLPQKPQMSCSSKAQLMLTWWDRDLLIWRLPQRLESENPAFTMPTESSHQLLARLELKGDESITSAQLSGNGRVVVAATATGVKLFQIRKRLDAEEIEVRTRPIDLPTGIRAFGASTVGFSPDSKWLCAVRLNNTIAMAKIVWGESHKDKPQIHQQTIKLDRKRRSKARSQSTKLGMYPEVINCIAFSGDSRILAVGDFSGAIDTWMLEGHEDLLDVTNDKDSSRSESSDTDSDSDSDDESDSRVIHGQKWVRNAPDSRPPQLDSAVLVMSFKPRNLSAPEPADAPLGLHATRHNPHPVSHELPPTDTKLVVVTASHQIIELEILSGKLSEWSRRNPSACLPQSFTQIKDRVMGVFWDCNNAIERQRLWLHGPTWLFMLDMNRDLNVVDAQDKIGQIGRYDVREPTADALVKRTAETARPFHLKKRRKRNTGAGDEKTSIQGRSTFFASSDPTGSVNPDTGLMSPVSDHENRSDSDSDSDEDIRMADASALTHLRRAERGESNQAENEMDSHNSDANIADPTGPPHHAIFRYRSIFGVCALEPGMQTQEIDSASPGPDAAPSLEIVLVERPMYDVELLPRFDGGQDWAT